MLVTWEIVGVTSRDGETNRLKDRRPSDGDHTTTIRDTCQKKEKVVLSNDE